MIQHNPWAVLPVGSMDVGGSSTQIAYQTTQRSASTVELHLFDPDHPILIFSQSFPHFGIYDARSIYEDRIIEAFEKMGAAHTTEKLHSPCYLPGTHENKIFRGVSHKIFGNSGLALFFR